MSIKFLDEQEMVCICGDEPAIDCPIHGIWLSSAPGEFVLPKQDFLVTLLKKASDKPCTRYLTRKDIEDGLRGAA
jgi:hypothetical protein